MLPPKTLPAELEWEGDVTGLRTVWLTNRAKFKKESTSLWRDDLLTQWRGE